MYQARAPWNSHGPWHSLTPPHSLFPLPKRKKYQQISALLCNQTSWSLDKPFQPKPVFSKNWERCKFPHSRPLTSTLFCRPKGLDQNFVSLLFLLRCSINYKTEIRHVPGWMNMLYQSTQLSCFWIQRRQLGKRFPRSLRSPHLLKINRATIFHSRGAKLPSKDKRGLAAMAHRAQTLITAHNPIPGHGMDICTVKGKHPLKNKNPPSRAWPLLAVGRAAINLSQSWWTAATAQHLNALTSETLLLWICF